MLSSPRGGARDSNEPARGGLAFRSSCATLEERLDTLFTDMLVLNLGGLRSWLVVELRTFLACAVLGAKTP
jgi:hypothetical protein